ncbi:ABC transporter ATP-binding protein [Bacillus sp. FJAT-42376]|uniref:ABC transporter ATP-binding protein n=1 Tax=Bacillus sp. FJAT-42376 TaxID=2014076 RepID=UPI000F513C8A|nr:ABC transporter ATP-binding protein [Bacillus sp. FJAT-42376]AZB44462.1 ABC transporter ATP-binding protein [Bacillus sp. FJAT-42376]
MKSVELSSLSKTYDGKNKVIDSIDAVIQEGEFFVLVGPSGCGKSTILRMIAGLEEVSEGTLRIGGKEANHLHPSKRDLSMVFQNYALYPHLTVAENITFGLHSKKISKQEQKKRCEEACDMLGLSALLKRKPRELSGGQRQRVALARAIVTHAPICLMDEPLSNLDAKLRAKMRSEIRQIQRKLGITMIYVTHDQTEAMTMADRMMIMHEGSIQQLGKPLEIYNNPANSFVASFIGSPPMNLAQGAVDGGSLVLGEHHAIPLSKETLLALGSGKVEAGIRPEHLKKEQEGDMVLRGTVANAEILGTETLISFNISKDKQWIARWPGQWVMQPGDPVNLSFSEKDLLFFDSENGRRISFPVTSHSAVEKMI